MKQLTTDTPRVWDVCRYAQDNYFENTAGELETWTLAVPGMTWYARLLKRSPNEPALRGRLAYSFIYTYSSLCLRHVSCHPLKSALFKIFFVLYFFNRATRFPSWCSAGTCG
jgi:hypothetical protein